MNWQLEFERCLEKRWLVKMPEARHLVIKELRVAFDDLNEAESSYQHNGYKWSTIQSYYAMFHAARALLYSREYREKSHRCLSVAVRYLVVSQGVLDEQLIDDMDDARALREDADYRSEFSSTGAWHNLNAAKRLVDQVKELLVGWQAPSGDESAEQEVGK